MCYLLIRVVLWSRTIPTMHGCTHDATLIPAVQRFSCFPCTHNATLFLLLARQNSFVLCALVIKQVSVFVTIMWCEIQQVVAKYVGLMQLKSYVQPFSYGRGLLRDDGGPNRLFFKYLFGHNALAISFLQDVK